MTKADAVSFFINILNIVLGSLVVMLLWNWFIPITSISYGAAMGITLLISYFTTDISEAIRLSRNDEERFEHNCYGLFFTVLILVLGFVLHLFV